MAVKKTKKKPSEYMKKMKKLSNPFSHYYGPETHQTARRVKITIYGRGDEVKKPVTSVKGVVTKVYDSDYIQHIQKRYKFAKELIKKGAPINEPRIYTRDDKLGKRLVWKEKDLGMPLLKRIINARAQNNVLEEKELMKKYKQSADKLKKIAFKSKIKVGDVGLTHAYLTEKGNVLFSDVILKLTKKG